VSLVGFCQEEQVEAFGEKLTLRLDFLAMTTIEGALNGTPMPIVVAHVRSGQPSYTILVQMLWAMTREHHRDLSHSQILEMVMDTGPDGAKVGLALDALLERGFPMPKPDEEDKKPKNVRKRRGASRTSAAGG